MLWVDKRTGSTKIGKPIVYNGSYNVGMTHYLKRRLNILSLAVSWALWCCLCCTHVIFNRVEPPLKRRLNILSLALSWAVWCCLCCTHVIINRVEPPLKAMVGSILTLHLRTFEQLFWPTTWRKNPRKAQWQAQSRYLCHCAFFVSFRYAGFEKTWRNHFISISLALVIHPAVLRR